MNIKSKHVQIRSILSNKENKHEKHYTMFPDKHKMESIMVYNIKDKHHQWWFWPVCISICWFESQARNFFCEFRLACLAYIVVYYKSSRWTSSLTRRILVLDVSIFGDWYVTELTDTRFPLNLCWLSWN